MKVSWEEVKKIIEDDAPFINLADKIECVYGTKENYEELFMEFIEACAIIDCFHRTPKYLKKRLPCFWRDYYIYRRYAKRLAKLLEVFELKSITNQ